MRAIASPYAAWRPLAAVSGPVGFAETYSTLTFSRFSGEPRPQSSPAATTCRAAATYHGSARKTFRKPGPATSTRSTASPSRALSFSPEPLRDLARGRAERGREQHRRVRRVVAEAGLLRPLQARARRRRGLAVAQVAGGRLDRGAQIIDRVRHGNDGTARWRGSCAHGRAARAARRARACAAASAARTRGGGRRSGVRCRTRRRSRSRRRGRPGGAPRASPRTPRTCTCGRGCRAGSTYARSGIRRSSASSSATSITSTRAWRDSSFS